MKALKALLIGLLLASTLLAVGVWKILGPVDSEIKQSTVFVVPEDDDRFDLARELRVNHLIRSQTAFWWYDFFFGPSGDVISGGYRLSPSMNTKEILSVLHSQPKLRWVKVREGLRNEQIGELLTATLGWSDDVKAEWSSYTKNNFSQEGKYFPGTYLFPTDEPAANCAHLMLSAFTKETADLEPLRRRKNISWNTVLTIASLLQREAAGSEDMNLISGII